jgi:SSS family transporter
MDSSTATYLGAALAYLIAVAIVVAKSYRRSSSHSEFLTASRSIGPWVGGATLAATQISAGTFVGTVGQHYATGVSFAWIWFGLWAGWWVCAAFVAPKLRNSGALTVPDYMGRRYGGKAPRIVSALLIVFAYSIVLSAQYQAAGEIVQATFGLQPIIPIAIILGFTAVYTLVGGVRAGSNVDMLQMIIIVVGLAIGLPLLVHTAGGLAESGRFLAQLDPRLVTSHHAPSQLIAVGLAFGLSMAASPYELARFYSMRDGATTRYAVGVSILFQFLIGAAVLVMGLMTRVLFPQITSPDQASPTMAFEALPPIAGALFLVAILSAVMSSSNSILIVASSGLAHDVYGKWLAPTFKLPRSDRFLVRLNRAMVLLVAVVPVWLALRKLAIVQLIVIEAASFIASIFFASVVIGLNWRRGTAAGAVASMIAGFSTCWIWSKPFGLHEQLPQWLGRFGAVEAGVVVSSIVFVVVSRLTQPVDSQVLGSFFRQGLARSPNS